MFATRVVLFFSILSLVSSLTYASDPDPLQDFCIGVNDSKAGVFVNGKFCKDPNHVTSDDFYYSGFDKPGNTSNPFGSRVTHAFIDDFLGGNTHGISLVRIDYAPRGINPPHNHPRASEIFMVTKGKLYVGFIASNPQNPYTRNKLFAKTLGPGDLFVYPRGSIHFQYNIGKGNAVAFAGFNSQNPGVVTLANAMFGSKPSFYSEVIAKAFQMEKKYVQQLQSLPWVLNN